MSATAQISEMIKSIESEILVQDKVAFKPPKFEPFPEEFFGARIYDVQWWNRNPVILYEYLEVKQDCYRFAAQCLGYMFFGFNPADAINHLHTILELCESNEGVTYV